jgi:hypothetical protein
MGGRWGIGVEKKPAEQVLIKAKKWYLPSHLLSHLFPIGPKTHMAFSGQKFPFP